VIDIETRDIFEKCGLFFKAICKSKDKIVKAWIGLDIAR
jgi:hypothetical protein